MPDIERTPKPITNQKMWEMVKVITEKQKAAKELPTETVPWNMVEEMWFDWLEEELFENDNTIAKTDSSLEELKYDPEYQHECKSETCNAIINNDSVKCWKCGV